MIRFDSDYLEGCLPEILSALQDTNYEQTPGYGEDRHCEEARALIREACGTPEADVHFLVGGTQTNATVIASILRPYQGVLCADSGHINVHETGAVEHTGHKVLPLPSVDGKIDAVQIDAAMTAHRDDPTAEHAVQPAMVYISFPTEKGSLYTLSELAAISKVCRNWGIPLFVDGARLGYGLVSEGCDVTLRDIAALADVFYIGGTKQGALFGEAVVFTGGAGPLSRGFRYNIKQNGGMLAKGRLLGLQFKALFTDGLYLRAAKGAVEKALRLRDTLSAKGYEFMVWSPSNQQFPILTDAQIEDLGRDFGFEVWQKMPDGRSAARFCTSWATTDSAIDALVSRL